VASVVERQPWKGGAPVSLDVAYRLHLLRHREIAEPVPFLGNVADPWPIEVVGEQRHAVGCEHTQHPNAALCRLNGVGVKEEVSARTLWQQDRVVGKVGGVAELLATGLDDEIVWLIVWPGAESAVMPGRISSSSL